MRNVRTGMVAYAGIAAKVQAEREAAARAEKERYEAARIAAEEQFCWAQVERPVAATMLCRIEDGLQYQTHYGAGVTVTHRTRKHIVLTARY